MKYVNDQTREQIKSDFRNGAGLLELSKKYNLSEFIIKYSVDDDFRVKQLARVKRSRDRKKNISNVSDDFVLNVLINLDEAKNLIASYNYKLRDLETRKSKLEKELQSIGLEKANIVSEIKKCLNKIK